MSPVDFHCQDYEDRDNDDDLRIFESVWPPVAEGNNVVEKDEKALQTAEMPASYCW